MMEHLHWYFQNDQLSVTALETLTYLESCLHRQTSFRVKYLAIWTCRWQEVRFFNIPAAPIGSEKSLHQSECFVIPLKKWKHKTLCFTSHILIIIQLDSCARDLVQPNNIIVTTMWLWKAWRKANYWQLQTKSHLHVKCNHLSAMNPGIHWIIVRRVNPCALWIHPQYILLSEPE